MRRRDLIDAEDLIEPQVQAAIDTLTLGTEHDGMVKLALVYARSIDGAGLHCSGCDDSDCKRADRSWAVRWIGPLLADALNHLGASPASAAAIAKAKGDKKPDAPPVGLAKLRQARPGA